MSTMAAVREVAKRKASRKHTTLVPLLVSQCKALRLPPVVTELRFDVNGRKWRFDVAIVSLKLAVEIEGGAFLPGGSRHTRGAGFRADRIKYGTAFAQGWTVLTVMPEQVKSGEAVRWLEDRVKLIEAFRGVPAASES